MGTMEARLPRPGDVESLVALPRRGSARASVGSFLKKAALAESDWRNLKITMMLGVILSTAVMLLARMS